MKAKNKTNIMSQLSLKLQMFRKKDYTAWSCKSYTKKIYNRYEKLYKLISQDDRVKNKTK